MKTLLRPAAARSPQRRSRPHVNDRPYLKTRPSVQHPRRQFLGLAAGAAALPAVSRIAWAQVYPSRPITMIVPLVAGGTNDAAARILAERMRQSLRQPTLLRMSAARTGASVSDEPPEDDGLKRTPDH
jgi:hypothetical protein